MTSPWGGRLTKHHGLGNDFLVLFSAPSGFDASRQAVALCDRRRGFGADGLIVVHPVTGAPADGTGAGFVMELYNADGSRAEMSGNGIRCLAQALWMRPEYRADTFRIQTDAGLRIVEVCGTDDPLTVRASVDMGPVTAGPVPANWAALGCDDGRPVCHLSLGNPHSVVLTDDVELVDLATLGTLVPDTNLEIVQAATSTGAIIMRVHERGAGITEACGTGACAAAYAARSWGLVGDRVTVHQPGGDAEVVIADRVTLIGPATYIGEVIVPLMSAPPAASEGTTYE